MFDESMGAIGAAASSAGSCIWNGVKPDEVSLMFDMSGKSEPSSGLRSLQISDNSDADPRGEA